MDDPGADTKIDFWLTYILSYKIQKRFDYPNNLTLEQLCGAPLADGPRDTQGQKGRTCKLRIYPNMALSLDVQLLINIS